MSNKYMLIQNHERFQSSKDIFQPNFYRIEVMFHCARSLLINYCTLVETTY